MDEPPRRPDLLEAVRRAIRVRHYSYRSERAYVFWIRRFVRFHGRRSPRELDESHVGAFLTHLAVERGVAPGTQDQALRVLHRGGRAVMSPLGAALAGGCERGGGEDPGAGAIPRNRGP